MKNDQKWLLCGGKFYYFFAAIKLITNHKTIYYEKTI